MAGASRFMGRVWRLAHGLSTARPAARPDASGADSHEVRRTIHRTIAAVTEALDGFAFNVAVAKLYELVDRAGRGGAGRGVHRSRSGAKACWCWRA